MKTQLADIARNMIEASTALVTGTTAAAKRRAIKDAQEQLIDFVSKIEPSFKDEYILYLGRYVKADENEGIVRYLESLSPEDRARMQERGLR